jgi:hypothetical protein
MNKSTIAFTVVLSLISASAYGQQCLHGTGESPAWVGLHQ